jgi:thiamine pyrophosphokinase
MINTFAAMLILRGGGGGRLNQATAALILAVRLLS